MQNIFWNSSTEGDGQLCDGEKMGLLGVWGCFSKDRPFNMGGFDLGPVSLTPMHGKEACFTDCLNVLTIKY